MQAVPHKSLEKFGLQKTDMFGIVFLLAGFILSVLSLFSGVLSRTENNLRALKIWVVDFDGSMSPYDDIEPIIGPIITDIIMEDFSSARQCPTLIQCTPHSFQNDSMAVRQAVYEEQVYAAVIINANATSSLQAAVTSGSPSYDPLGIAQIVYNSARDENTYYAYIIPTLFQLQTKVITKFGPRWIEMMRSNGSLNDPRIPTQALSPSIGFTEIDLRPFSPAVATPSVSIGLIYLIIIAYFAFPFLMPIHNRLNNKRQGRPVKASHMLLWRLMSNFVAYFILSFFYSLIPLAFGIPFSNPRGSTTEVIMNGNEYGKSSFVVYWMLNWVGMTALGLPSENMAMIIGAPWSALWLTFWVISNVSTGFYPLDLAPGFYKWGYIWPLHRVVEGSRTILFGTHSRIGLDFGVLFGWVGVSILLFPFAAAIADWKAVSKKK
ncbi:hypothetical protein TCE0_015f01671 [Talaromyces pinophilus]|uniref:DUF3533 domain-containing protein n=1 Tax=Talaromyces pinophilus TaxID=128442 RepID=A0A6V8GZD7_TALPI|nr:hypothetical protein TCE0_015f01671 [Talaromyces pinophilus]